MKLYNDQNPEMKEKLEDTNLSTLIRTNRMMSQKEIDAYYFRFRKFYLKTNDHSIKINLLRRTLTYAAIMILLVGVTVALWNIAQNNTERVSDVVVKTQNGQKAKVELADGTVVWLNYGSSITYNSNYGKSNRDINLSGEAFFAVQKNKEIAFKVHTNKLLVKVLGTQFNVKAYPTSKMISVSLNKGSLQVSDIENKLFNYTIKPGEVANYDVESNNLSIKKVNSFDLSSWTNGYLFFDKTPLQHVFAELELKYNVNIIVADSSLYSNYVSAKIKDEYVFDVINSIAFISKFRYKIKNTKSTNEKIEIVVWKQ